MTASFYKDKNRVGFNLRRFTDISNLIIPFFDNYKIEGVKNLDFEDFKNVALIVKNKEHLTVEGFERIIKIYNNMNLRRS